MATFPLLFQFQGALIGRGFVAEIEVTGSRVLASIEDTGDVWLYGVNPGAIAENGDSLEDANSHFRKAIYEVLIDMAKESRTFGELKAQVEAFFITTNEPVEVDWKAALARIRESREKLGDLPVHRVTALKVAVNKKPLKDLRPSDNRPQVNAALAKVA
jgi:hypothetical protein